MTLRTQVAEVTRDVVRIGYCIEILRVAVITIRRQSLVLTIHMALSTRDRNMSASKRELRSRVVER
jgi:hypothetical protein